MVDVSVFGLPGVQSVFVVYGLAFMALVLLGSVVMVNPPKGYTPEGWVPPAANAQGGADYAAAEMLSSPQFYVLWTVFMCSALAGLMVIYCIKLFGIDALEHQGILDAGAINCRRDRTSFPSPTGWRQRAWAKATLGAPSPRGGTVSPVTQSARFQLSSSSITRCCAQRRNSAFEQ